MKEFTVDLDIAKELKENEFYQRTIFYHYKDCVDNKYKLSDTTPTLNDWISASNCDYSSPIYSAPTSDEILKELPYNINGYELTIDRFEGQYEVYYERTLMYESDTEYMKMITDKKPSNALARMWLYLKKKGYIK